MKSIKRLRVRKIGTKAIRKLVQLSHTNTFNSLEHLLEFNRTPVAAWDAGQDSQLKFGTFEADRLKWTGTATYADAERLAQEGWPKGAAKIKRYATAFFGKVSSRVHTSEFHQTVEPGVTFDVGAFCAGAPDHWITEEPRLVDGLGNRVLVVNYNIAMSGAVPVSVIAARGGAAIAMVQALELAGYSVELNAVDCSQGVKQGKLGRLTSFIRLKASCQPLNLNTLAFVFAHPSMQRRLIFRVTEHIHPEALASCFYHSYGYPVNLTNGERGDVYFPAMNSNDDMWLDPHTAVAAILKMVKAQGVDIGV